MPNSSRKSSENKINKELLDLIANTLLEKEILDKENSLIQRRLIKDGLDQI